MLCYETIRHMAYGCKWAKDVRNIVFTKWWGRTGDSSPVTLPSFRRSVLYTITGRESSMDTMRRTLNHITTYFIWRMRCSIVYSDEVATPPVITANAPMPFRGKTNTPAYVPYVAQQLASVKGLSVETIAQATSENFNQLFPQIFVK